MTTDVLIIGGGIAGVSAALAAVRSGARTMLVRAAPGATALAAGGWAESPPVEIARALAAADLELVRCTGALPHPDGRLIPAQLAPGAHAAAALTAAQRAPGATLVCGIAGLPSFRARALAALWADAAGTDSVPGHTTLALPGTPAGGWSPAALAALLEREPDRLTDVVAAAVRAHGASHVILPAVLGMDAHARVLDAVQTAAGVPIGEALGAAPSVPGWRLDRALLRTLGAHDVPVVAGRVTTHTARGGEVQTITVGAQTITAGSYVLATGKFVGGGIAMDDRFSDTVFDTDVAIHRHGRAFTTPDSPLVLTDAVRTEPQPVLSAGVVADAESRMLALSGDVVFSNVFVAGSVRAGLETATCGLGSAAHDGWSAGLRAAGSSAPTGRE